MENEIKKLRSIIGEQQNKITKLKNKIEFMSQDIGFLQSCINSGEMAKPEDRPSYKRKGKK